MLGSVRPEGWSRRDFLGRSGAAAAAAAAGGIGLGAGGLSAPAGAASRVANTSAQRGGDSAIPSERRIFRWIQEVFEQGVRRPGYPADAWVEDWLVRKFRGIRLDNVRKEPITVDRWEPRQWSLDVIREGAATVRLDSFPVPFSPPVDSMEVDLAAYNPALPDAVAGKASLYDEPLLTIPANALLLAGSAPPDPTGRFHDPDLTLGLPHTLPFGADFQSVLEPSANAGAAAFVGSLPGYPGDSYQYYVPYWGGTGPIPGIWTSGSSGAWLRSQMALGAVKVRINVASTNVAVRSYNVVGELRGGHHGRDEEMVIVGSHHDGPWNSAVEDGSGISLVLAQAEYWARQRPKDRPHRMVFLLHGGHMSGGTGLHGYIEAHEHELDKVVLELHLEHAAREFTQNADGEVVPNGMVTPRWWFTSRIERLEQAVYDALVDNDLRRSMILAPDAFGEQPPTDGGFYHNQGVPIVNFLTAPFYLFDAMDTLDKVDRAGLRPLSRATASILASTSGVTAAEMRGGS